MSELPEDVVDLFLTCAVRSRSPAFLRLAKDGRLIEWGGDVRRYGLTDLESGASATRQIPFLDGLLPPDCDHLFLPLIATTREICADVHIVRGDADDWALLLDVSLEAARRQDIQQQTNETDLRRTK